MFTFQNPANVENIAVSLLLLFHPNHLLDRFCYPLRNKHIEPVETIKCVQKRSNKYDLIHISNLFSISFKGGAIEILGASAHIGQGNAVANLVESSMTSRFTCAVVHVLEGTVFFGGLVTWVKMETIIYYNVISV